MEFVADIILVYVDHKNTHNLCVNRSITSQLMKQYEDNSFWLKRIVRLFEDKFLEFPTHLLTKVLNWRFYYFELINNLTDKHQILELDYIEISCLYNPKFDLNYTFRLACKNGCIEVVKLLLQDPRVDPTANDNYAFIYACENGHTEVVKLLLEDPRVDPSANNNFAIHCASENGHTEIVRLLLQDPRVDPSADNNFAIHCASQNGHIEIVRLLLQDARIDPTPKKLNY